MRALQGSQEAAGAPICQGCDHLAAALTLALTPQRQSVGATVVAALLAGAILGVGVVLCVAKVKW